MVGWLIMDTSLSKLQDFLLDKEALCAVVREYQRIGYDRTSKLND